MRFAGNAVEARIEPGTRIPPGGLIVRSPADRPVRQAMVNGSVARTDAGQVVVRRLPAVVTFRY